MWACASRWALTVGEGSGSCAVGVIRGNGQPITRPGRPAIAGWSPSLHDLLACHLAWSPRPAPALAARTLTHQSTAYKTEKQPRPTHQNASERNLHLCAHAAGAHTPRRDNRGKRASPGWTLIYQAHPPGIPTTTPRGLSGGASALSEGPGWQ